MSNVLTRTKTKSQDISAFAASNANLLAYPFKNNFREKQSATIPLCSHIQPYTCVHNPLYLDAGVVQLLGEGVHSLQQVLAGLRINVGPPCWDLNCAHKQTCNISLANVNLDVYCWGKTFYSLENQQESNTSLTVHTLVCSKKHIKKIKASSSSSKISTWGTK